LTGPGRPRRTSVPKRAIPLAESPGAYALQLRFDQTRAILFRGAYLDIIWPEFAWVGGIGAFLFTTALMRFRKTLIEAQS
jgi:hypothetical protein